MSCKSRSVVSLFHFYISLSPQPFLHCRILRHLQDWGIKVSLGQWHGSEVNEPATKSVNLGSIAGTHMAEGEN